MLQAGREKPGTLSLSVPKVIVKRMPSLIISALPVLEKWHGRNNNVNLLQLRRKLYTSKVPTWAIKLVTLV